MSRTWKIVGMQFDHFHMGDLLRMVHEHPSAEIVGLCDPFPERMEEAAKNFDIPTDRRFTDPDECLDITRPDLVILCPKPSEHALWTERIAPRHVHILMEKPFASSLADADRMIHAMQRTGKQLAINWPLRWYPSHATTYRLIQDGAIGDVIEVHYYDGNRGPLWHGADKIEREPTVAEKETSWFYRRDAGGGSLLDYLGYGTTLGTWFMQNQRPLEVCCLSSGAEGLEVDEHSITIARYASGLSKFETRWGTLSDPWTHQPLPKCGFVVRGTQGAISSYDFEPAVRLQTRSNPAGQDIPVDPLKLTEANPIAYFLDCLTKDRPVDGPLSTEVSRIGQQIVDTAFLSAKERRALPLLN